jgi:hypothetical protein
MDAVLKQTISKISGGYNRRAQSRGLIQITPLCRPLAAAPYHNESCRPSARASARRTLFFTTHHDAQRTLHDHAVTTYTSDQGLALALRMNLQSLRRETEEHLAEQVHSGLNGRIVFGSVYAVAAVPVMVPGTPLPGAMPAT